MKREKFDDYHSDKYYEKNIEYAIDDNIVNTFDNIRLKKTDGLKVFSIIGFNRNKTRIKQIIFLHQQV